MSEHHGSGSLIAAACVIGVVLALASIPYWPVVRREFDLLPRRTDVAIPPELQVSPDYVVVAPVVFTAPTDQAVALDERLARIDRDPESRSRTYRLARIKNATVLRIRFLICAKDDVCGPEPYVLDAGKAMQLRWPASFHPYLCFDSDATDAHRHSDADLTPAVATALDTAPKQPVYAFVKSEDDVRVVLQRVD